MIVGGCVIGTYFIVRRLYSSDVIIGQSLPPKQKYTPPEVNFSKTLATAINNNSDVFHTAVIPKLKDGGVLSMSSHTVTKNGHVLEESSVTRPDGTTQKVYILPSESGDPNKIRVIRDTETYDRLQAQDQFLSDRYNKAAAQAEYNRLHPVTKPTSKFGAKSAPPNPNPKPPVARKLRYDNEGHVLSANGRILGTHL